jgi:hypothetical protein
MKMILYKGANAHVTQEHVLLPFCLLRSNFESLLYTFTPSARSRPQQVVAVTVADEAFRLRRVSFSAGYRSFSVSNIIF